MKFCPKSHPTLIKLQHQLFCILHFCHTCSLCRVELVLQVPARGSTQVLLCLFPGVLWLWHFLYSVGPHPVSSLHIYTFVVSRGHSWRVRLAKQETLTPPGHLVSPLVCRGPWMSTVVLYCWCHSDGASVLLYFTFRLPEYQIKQIAKNLVLSLRAKAQHHNGAIRNDLLLRPGPRTLRLFDVKSTYDIRKTYCQSISAEIMLCWHFMLLENAPSVECMEKRLCFLLKHRNIIATAYWILLLKPSFVISQGQTCWHTFRALMSAKNKRPMKCMKPKLTPVYFHSSHAWYTWLLYYKIQQFFLECVRMHEYNNDIAFPSHSSIHTAILNIHCFFFPLVYIRRNDVYILIQPLSLYYICHDKGILLLHWNFQNRPFYLNKSSYTVLMYVNEQTFALKLTRRHINRRYISLSTHYFGWMSCLISFV